MGLEVETKKTVTTLGHGRGKGFMKGLNLIAEKPPVLLQEDSKYALEKLSSIIMTKDYEDLSNHATEVMEGRRLFWYCSGNTSVIFSFSILHPTLY